MSCRDVDDREWFIAPPRAFPVNRGSIQITEKTPMAHSAMRRRFLQSAVAAAALSRVPFASAQGTYPSGAMRVVVPTAQGGSADRLANVFDDFWRAELKLSQPFDYQFMA